MISLDRKKAVAKIPLRIVLIVLFVTQIVVIVGLVGYSSFQNGQRAVNDVAHQLRGEIIARIEEHLFTFLSTPHQIIQNNAISSHQAFLDSDDPEVLQHHFWEQIHIYDSVTSIYFGNKEGGLVGAGREGAEGSLYVLGTDQLKKGAFYK